MVGRGICARKMMEGAEVRIEKGRRSCGWRNSWHGGDSKRNGLSFNGRQKFKAQQKTLTRQEFHAPHK